MRNVSHRFPFLPALFHHALALGLNGRHEEARIELVRFRKLHPPEHDDEPARTCTRWLVEVSATAANHFGQRTGGTCARDAAEKSVHTEPAAHPADIGRRNCRNRVRFAAPALVQCCVLFTA